MKIRTLLALVFACWIAAVHAQYGPGEDYEMDTRTYTALWWNPAESGWGLNTTHQGNTLFATLFTYDTDGQPLWLVASNLAHMPGMGGYGMEDYAGTQVFAGPLYRTTGPAFNASPWTPIGHAQVGTMSIEFDSPTTAVLSYTFAGATVIKPVQRQVFGATVPECFPTTGSRAGESNYQDLWWNPAESGWGINLVQQGAVIFATLFTYAESGRDRWLVASGLTRGDDGAFSGALYATTGPTFNASPWRPIDHAQVGAMTLRFTDGENATLTYNIGAASVAKQIRRQVFATVTSACR